MEKYSPIYRKSFTEIGPYTARTSTSSFGHADVLSKLNDRNIKPEEEFVVTMVQLGNSVRCIIKEAISFLAVLAKIIAKENKSDSVLRKLSQYILEGCF